MAGPGDRLADRYELIEPIGAGGMAIVWRARDTRLRRTVAIKILRPQFAEDPEFVRRFESEAHHAGSLAHPNVATVYDTGADADTRFIVMELVDGPTLADVMRRDGVLPPALAVDIAASAARGLAAAHRRGLVHRDLKPANLLIGRDGRVRLADFGIARALTSGRLTTVGMVLGSAPYMSPEQTRGEEVTAAGDIFSLGVVLFEMLHGRLPWPVERAAAVSPEGGPGEWGPIEASDMDLPAGLDAIVARALQIDPTLRYASARAFAEALEVAARHLRDTAQRERVPPQALTGLAPGPIAITAGAADFTTQSARTEPYAPTRIHVSRGPARDERRRRRALAPPAIAGIGSVGVAIAIAVMVLSTGAQLIGGVLEATATAPPLALGPTSSATGALVQSAVPSSSASASSAIVVERPSMAPVLSPVPTVRPAATARPTPNRTPTPSIASPSAAVVDFYDAVEDHDWDRAIARWSRSMRERYPPDEWLIGRFSRTTRMDIVRLRQTALNSSAGTATVAVSLVEYRSVEPSPRSFAGSWELVRVNGRWLLNEPHF